MEKIQTTTATKFLSKHGDEGIAALISGSDSSAYRSDSRYKGFKAEVFHDLNDPEGSTDIIRVFFSDGSVYVLESAPWV